MSSINRIAGCRLTLFRLPIGRLKGRLGLWLRPSTQQSDIELLTIELAFDPDEIPDLQRPVGRQKVIDDRRLWHSPTFQEAS